MNHIAKIDRVRNLLSFDFSLLDPAQQTTMSALLADGQTSSSFGDPSRSGNRTSSLRLVGFDEAGRGALAGPVTVACVSFDLSRLRPSTGGFRESILETYADLNDSKQVSERNRERLNHLIQEQAHWGIGYASAVEIDHLGIVKACGTAAIRAYRCLGRGLGLGYRADLGLFDRGLTLGEGDGAESIRSSIQLTKGDARSFHIAAASILAKVCRDAVMRDLDVRTELYGFARHKGYGTAAHFDAIQQHGPSRFHRRTFLH